MTSLFILAHWKNTQINSKVLSRLQTGGLSLQPEKCHFLQKEIAYLGHVITQDDVKPDPWKIEAVPKISSSKNSEKYKTISRINRIL